MSCWKELRTCLNRWDLILEQSLPSTSWYCNSHTEGEKDFQNMLTKQLYPSIAPCACYFQSAALSLLHVCHDGSPVCAQSSTEWLYPKSMVTWLVTTLWMLNSAANKPFCFVSIQIRQNHSDCWCGCQIWGPILPSWCQQLLSARFHIITFTTAGCFLFHARIVKDSWSDLVLSNSGRDRKKT